MCLIAANRIDKCTLGTILTKDGTGYLNPFHMDPKMRVKSGSNLHSTRIYTFHMRELTLDIIWVEPCSRPWIESGLKMAERRADRGATWHDGEVKALLEIWSSEVLQAQLSGAYRNEAVYQRSLTHWNSAGLSAMYSSAETRSRC